jgi:hypothetical protein
MPRNPSPTRKFKLDDSLGEILDVLLESQSAKHVETMVAEVKARTITDSTRHVLIAWGYLLPAVSADPRLVDISAPANRGRNDLDGPKAVKVTMLDGGPVR